MAPVSRRSGRKAPVESECHTRAAPNKASRPPTSVRSASSSGTLMLSDVNISSALCNTLAHEFHPDQIVLFGSYAYDQPHPDADVDLLIVMPFEGRPFRQAARLP